MCFPAAAQEREYKSGVNSTRLYNAPKAKTTQPTNAAETKKDGEELTAADRVWERYKALAMGQAEETPEEKPSAKAPTKPEKPEEPKVANVNPPKKTGMASMIENYQKNKDSRKDMRSMRFNAPQAEE